MKHEQRGRPKVFEYEQRQKLAELVRCNGARPTKATSDVQISVNTLLKIAREFGVVLKKGRRKAA